VAPAIERARHLSLEPLGVVLETPIRRAPVGTESPLGNLFAEGMLAAVPDAHLVINNTRGGLRADLDAGPLTYGRLYEAFPFENRLVRVALTGAQLARVVRAQLGQSRGLAGIAGLRVQASCHAGGLAVALERSSGGPIRPADKLIVATTDFIATGGDGILSPVMPAAGFPIGDDLPLARDAVVDWLRRRGGALRDRDLIDQAAPRWQLPGPLPVRCR
jgi:2',3'-cyclic-nucleotide 2'-phosphodiesterase (5'-nucleotidase family)